MIIGISVILLLIAYLACVYVTEYKFKIERDSIRGWLKHHGFFVEYEPGVFIDYCKMDRIGSFQEYKSYMSCFVYWKLYNIRKKKLDRTSTVRALNEMVGGMVCDVKVEPKNDFWKD